MVEGPAPVGTEAGLDLPDAFVVQVEFEPGRYQPEVVDQDELRRIAEAISRSQRMRVELVGHAVPLDGLAGDLARELALERAEAVAEQIRYHGPSRRRFSARPARVDEPMPEPRVPARPGKLHAVELRVVHR
jgi:flagellar motor protein MotB